MPCDEGCRTAVLGKTERTVGWEGNGCPVRSELVRHCIGGNPQSTDRLWLPPLNHSFTLDVNVYVQSRRAGERVMESLTRFVEGRVRLKVNRTKSAVDRPWKRKFLGYTVTTHFSPRLKPAPESLKRGKDRIRQITQAGRGRNIRKVIAEINEFTRGWIGYFRLATVKDTFDKLDQWIRRRLRKILWEQWKKPKTRCRKMVALGLEVSGARKATATGRGAGWNAGASHMHTAVNNRMLAAWGLLNLLAQLRALQRCT